MADTDRRSMRRKDLLVLAFIVAIVVGLAVSLGVPRG